MSPEQKAKELLNRFASHAHTTRIATAAIICVEEIIKSWEEDGNRRLDKPVIDYWNEVKTLLTKQSLIK